MCSLAHYSRRSGKLVQLMESEGRKINSSIYDKHPSFTFMVAIFPRSAGKARKKEAQHEEASACAMHWCHLSGCYLASCYSTQPYR